MQRREIGSGISFPRELVTFRRRAALRREGGDGLGVRTNENGIASATTEVVVCRRFPSKLNS
jgi:hypothetical protein